MVDNDFVRLAELFSFTINMVVFQAVAAHFYLGVCCIHGAETIVEAVFFVFLYVSLQRLKIGQGDGVLIVEICQAPQDQHLKKH